MILKKSIFGDIRKIFCNVKALKDNIKLIAHFVVVLTHILQSFRQLRHKKLKNCVNECCEFIEIHATHGALLNGLLLWADIQRQTTPENIWKTQAITTLVSGKITEAKEILWRISGESILGKMFKRQGAAKSQSEINDICAAFKILPEKDCMPMFLSTSNMVSQTSIYNLYPVDGANSEVTARLKIVEESLNSIMTSEKMKIDNLQRDPTV